MSGGGLLSRGAQRRGVLGGAVGGRLGGEELDAGLQRGGERDAPDAVVADGGRGRASTGTSCPRRSGPGRRGRAGRCWMRTWIVAPGIPVPPTPVVLETVTTGGWMPLFTRPLLPGPASGSRSVKRPGGEVERVLRTGPRCRRSTILVELSVTSTSGPACAPRGSCAASGSSSSSPMSAPSRRRRCGSAGRRSGGAYVAADRVAPDPRVVAPSIQIPGAPGAGVADRVARVDERDADGQAGAASFVPMNALSPSGPTRIAAVAESRGVGRPEERCRRSRAGPRARARCRRGRTSTLCDERAAAERVAAAQARVPQAVGDRRVAVGADAEDAPPSSGRRRSSRSPGRRPSCCRRSRCRVDGRRRRSSSPGRSRSSSRSRSAPAVPGRVVDADPVAGDRRPLVEVAGVPPAGASPGPGARRPTRSIPASVELTIVLQ